MSTFKETLKNNRLYLEDEKITRLKKIQNMNKNDMISIAQWNASQAELYPNSLLLNQGPSLNEVLITQQKNDTNDMTNTDTAINYLSQISDIDTAKYIVEKITSLEVRSLIQQFEKFKRELIEYYPKGLYKDEFVQFVKLKQNDYLNPENTNFQPLTEQERNATTINESDDEFQYTTPIKKQKRSTTPYSTKMKKAKVEKATSKNIKDLFQQTNPMYEKQPETFQQAKPMYEKAEPFSYDNPDQLLINDNQDAMIFADEQINKIKQLQLAEIKSIITQYKMPINIKGTKKQILNDLKQHFYDEYNFGVVVPTPIKKEGGSLRKNKKVRFYGKGLGLGLSRKNVITDEFTLPNNRLKIDGDKLRNNNILKLKYKSNNNSHPNIKFQRVSQTLSDILYDIIKGKYDERFYKLLNPMEKELVKSFIKACKYNIDVDKNESDEFNKNYEILYSQIMSGNDSKEIKSKLKEYTIYGLKSGRLSRNDTTATLALL